MGGMVFDSRVPRRDNDGLMNEDDDDVGDVAI